MLTTAQADAIFRNTRYMADLDDYAYEPGLGHVYVLVDGRQVLIADDGAIRLLDEEATYCADFGPDDEADDAIFLREPGRDVLIVGDGPWTVIPRAGD